MEGQHSCFQELQVQMSSSLSPQGSVGTTSIDSKFQSPLSASPLDESSNVFVSPTTVKNKQSPKSSSPRKSPWKSPQTDGFESRQEENFCNGVSTAEQSVDENKNCPNNLDNRNNNEKNDNNDNHENNDNNKRSPTIDAHIRMTEDRDTTSPASISSTTMKSTSVVVSTNCWKRLESDKTDAVSEASDSGNDEEDVGSDVGAAALDLESQRVAEHHLRTASTATGIGRVEDEDDEYRELRPINSRRRWWCCCCLRIVLFLLLAAFVGFLVSDTMTNGYVKRALLNFLQWIQDNPSEGVFLYTVVYCFATVLVIPAAIMMIGAGFIFVSAFGLGIGIALAVLSSFIGAFVSAIISFFIARFIIRALIHSLSRRFKLLKALDAAVQLNGFRIFTLLRLSPLIPFNAINYMAGASSVTFQQYTCSLFALIPGIVLGVVIGASMGSLTEAAENSDSNRNRITTICVSVLGATFSLIAITIVTIYTRKELNRAATENCLEYDASEAAERLTEADVVDALVEVMHGVQTHVVTGNSNSNDVGHYQHRNINNLDDHDFDVTTRKQFKQATQYTKNSVLTVPVSSVQPASGRRNSDEDDQAHGRLA